MNLHQESIFYLEKIIEKFPNNFNAHYSYAKIQHYKLNNLNNAKEFYLKALKIKKNDLNLLLDLSKVCEQNGNNESALEYL